MDVVDVSVDVNQLLNTVSSLAAFCCCCFCWFLVLSLAARARVCGDSEPPPDSIAKPRTCTVCLYAFKPGDRVRIIPCLHQFHTEVRITTPRGWGRDGTERRPWILRDA